MKKLLLIIIVFCTPFLLRGQPVLLNIGTTTVETSTLYTTNDAPWELKYGPGDSLWMTTKNGKVFRLDPNTGAATQLLDYSSIVYQEGEAGMLGMAFHPAFSANPYVYIAYTYTEGINKERLSRFTYSGSSLTDELVLVDNIAASTIHNGSRLLVLPDYTILMSTGDATNSADPQNTATLNGKILRVNLDGTTPADNPFAGSRVYTFGHRNAQGLVLHPNGKLYSTEHGPSNNDEFQVIEAGRNYGWPNVVGFCDNDVAGETAFCTANNVKEPLLSWTPAPGTTWAPSDLVWYDHPSIPEFQNSFLVTFLKTQKLASVRVNAAGDAVTAQADYFVNQWGRLRDITVGPDGSIYIATNTSPYRIIKLRAAIVTPVLLNNFRVTCVQEKYTIGWKTETEINALRFLLYKSSDGVNFDLLATIPSLAPGGNSSIRQDYSYTDNGNGTTPVFYKLVSEDRDGRKKVWGIAAPACGTMGLAFSLLPNPATRQAVFTMNGVRELVTIIVHNSAGQVVYQNRANGTLYLPVEKWGPGIYILTATNTRREVIYQDKLVVQ